MPTPSIRHADKANLKALFAGLKSKYEPKDDAIVHDASYVHTDANFTDAEKLKLAGIEDGATASGGGTITGVSTTAPLTGSGTSGPVTVGHGDSGVTAGTYGKTNSSSADETVADETNIDVPYFTVDAKGHVKSAGTHRYTTHAISDDDIRDAVDAAFL